MKSFQNLAHPICYSKEAETVYNKYKELSGLLVSYEDDVYDSWVKEVEKKTLESLDRPLLVRHKKLGTLKVNFGRETLGCLKEVKHLKREFPKRKIPKVAAKLFTRFEDFRAYNNCLDKIVDLYNYLKTDTIDKEYRLFEVEVAAIDKKLKAAETTLTWNSEDISGYIDQVREVVTELNLRVRQTQDNVIDIYKLISQWEEMALYIREEDGEMLLNLKDKDANKNARYAEIKEASKKITSLIVENKNLFDVDMDNDMSKKAWAVYLRHIDNIVTDSLLQSVAVSLGYILDETDVKKNPRPLFATRLELSQPEIVFEPSLDRQIMNNFFDQAISLVNDIMGMAGLVPRVALQKMAGCDYMETVMKNSELKRLRDDYITRLEKVMQKAKSQKDTYLDYSHLWTESRKNYLHYFLLYSRQLTAKELESLEENPKAVRKNIPELEDFREQIEHYEQLHEEVKLLPNTHIFNCWFRVDITPFKLTLLTNIKKWSYIFKKHLLDHVVDSLVQLHQFIEKADEGLQAQLPEGDYEGLVKVMEFLKMLKERQRKTDDMFEPLKEVIVLLRKYGVTIPEEVTVHLNELPGKWANTKRLTVNAKQIVGPLMGMEVGKLKERVESYEKQARNFRNRYTQMKFFSYNCEHPYEQLSKANLDLEDMEVKVKTLESESGLFEVTVPKFPVTKQCRRENRMLKQLWDYIYLVRTSIEEWKTTMWRDIDVENMDMECKKYSKDLRAFDKGMRDWHTFKGLDSTVKNMLTSLRAVEKLQNTAIRERHWEQLVQATKVRFSMNDDTTLADLLDLNLHMHEDEVGNIVDKACKEMTMEKMLIELKNTWSTMEFENEEHRRTGLTLLRASEDMIETLEENQVQLQNCITSKFIGHFFEEVSGWQKTLGLVDQVTTLWFDVQRTWSHLESIFVGSDDIRQQLPQDSDRFDDTNSKFTNKIKIMSKIPNVIEATSIPGTAEELEVALVNSNMTAPSIPGDPGPAESV
jgi:dynein heavy chain